MFRSRWFSGFCLFALALSQSSCIVDSVEPLSDPATAEVDSRLFGQWRHKEGTETLDYIIGRVPENSIKGCPPGVMVAYAFRRSAKDEVLRGLIHVFFVWQIIPELITSTCSVAGRQKPRNGTGMTCSHSRQANIPSPRIA